MTRQTPSVWGFSSLLRNREWEQGRHCCQPLEGLGWAEKVAPGETPARVGAPLSTPRAWDPGTLSTEPESPREGGQVPGRSRHCPQALLIYRHPAAGDQTSAAAPLRGLLYWKVARGPGRRARLP